MKFFLLKIVQVGFVLGANCPGGNCPGWELSGWELSRVGVVRVGVVRVGIVLGANCPVRIVRVGIVRVRIVLEPIGIYLRVIHLYTHHITENVAP